MNRVLLMCAASLLASAGAANAGTHSFTFSGYCDGGTITTGLAGGSLATWIHTNNNCASGTSQGAGYLIKVKGLGKVWWMSDNYFAKNGIYTEYLSYTFPKKIKTGGMWTSWVGFSGISNFEANSGALGNVTAGHHGEKGHGAASTAAMVAKLLAARRR